MTDTKKPNKLTEKAGLTFNVNTVRSALKDYYEGQDLSTPMFAGGHTAITATLEKVWELLVQECLKKVGKDKSGVRQVNREFLQYSVLLHSGFRRYFLSQLENFDSTLQYGDQVPVITSEMDKVMESVDSDISFTQRARNLACFMLLKVFSQLATVCHEMLSFAKKKSIDGRCVLSAVRVLFHESVANELQKEIVRVMKEFGEEIEDTSSDGAVPVDVQAAGEADPGDSDEEEEKPKSKSKKAPTKSTKTKKTQTIEVEEEEEEDEEDEEEEEAPKPKKSTKPAPKKGASKPTKSKK